MQNLTTYKKEIIMLSIGLFLLSLALFNIFNPSLSQRALGAQTKPTPVPTPTPTPDPRKEFKSLDTYITYSVPAGWQKEDYVDEQFGNNAFISLESPDYNSPETFVVTSGIKILISRSYDLTPEETLSRKLGAQYEFYTYNVMPLKIAGKDGMTMHEDYEGHNRFIYIPNGNHLWQIGIASKSLEDEAGYQGEIDLFLNSVKFKNKQQ